MRYGKFGTVVGVAALLVAVGASASAAEIPAGTEIPNGIVVHMTPKGIGFMENQVPALIPPQIAIPQVGPTNYLSCLLDHAAYTISNGLVNLTVGKVSIIPLEGKLQLHIEAVATASAHVSSSGCLLDFGCNISIDPSPLVADTLLDMAMVQDPQTGRPKVKVTPEAANVSIALGNLNLCSGIVGDILSAVVNLFLPLVQDQINGMINNQIGSQIGPMIENAFNALALQGSVNVAGSDLSYDLYPTDLQIHPGTIGIVMGGTFDAPNVAACVDPNKQMSYNGAAIPVFNDVSPAGTQYDLVASASDDMLNQVVFSLWRGGLLCRNIDSAGGQPLTTSYLSLIGGTIANIVTPDGPMVVHIEGEDPPLVTYGGANTINLSLSNLHIDLMADVQDRLARIMRLTLAPTAGVTLSMNASNQLVPELNFDANNLPATVDYNELAPDANDVVIALLPTLIQQLLPSLAGAIPPIDLPNMAGIQITGAEFTPEAPDNHYLSIYTSLGGQVQPGGCGAGGTGGCGVSGGTGCDVSGRPFRANVVSTLLMLGALGTVVFRRRRS